MQTANVIIALRKGAEIISTTWTYNGVGSH